MECFFSPGRVCNQEYAAFLRLGVAREALTIVQQGVPLFSDKKREIRTYCAVIASFWKLGEAISRVARAIESKERQSET